MIWPRSHILMWIGDYHRFPERRGAILNGLITYLSDIIDEEISAQKLIMAPHERAAEAGFAIIECFEPYELETSFSFEDLFLQNFRRALRKLKPRKDHVSIEGLSIEDPNGNPESIYIVKEQTELLKEFLSKHYDPITVDQFIRRYADNETYAEIAYDHGVTAPTLVQKLNSIMTRVSKYMKRINNG